MRSFIVYCVLGEALTAAACPIAVDLPKSAKPWERTAACELTNYLNQVVSDGRVFVVGRSDVIFHVGDTAFARGKGLGTDSLADEEWAIRTYGQDVVLNGGGSRGCLYAVYHFLEDQVGVRWWSDDEQDVPSVERLELPVLNRRGRPALRFREIYRGKPHREHALTQVRNYQNGGCEWPHIPVEYGGAILYGPPKHCHTWCNYFPYEQDGKDHPDWFSSWKGSRRPEDHWEGIQLCLTNDELAEEFKRRLLARIASEYEKAAKNGTLPPLLYDVSMNDSHSYCTCEKCAAETERYGHSGRQIRFFNKLAAAVAEKYPDVFITMLAYYGAEPPPKGGVVAAKNLVVKYCNTRQNQAAQFGEESNSETRKLLESWQGKAPNMFIWDYATTFRQAFVRGMPYPSEFTIGSKVRKFIECGVTGIFTEHEFEDIGDMWELKYYVMRKLYEDPSRDNVDLVKSFCNEYYGEKAGATIFKVRSLLLEAAKRKGAVVTWEPKLGAFNFINNKLLAYFDNLYDQAELQVKDDAKLLRRVRRARITNDKLRDLRRYLGGLRQPEKGVCDRPFYSMPVNARTTLIWNANYEREVDDPDAFEGKAVRITRRVIPFAVGINSWDYWSMSHDLPAIAESKGPGYNWYSLGTTRIPPKNSTLYYASWGVQTDPAFPALEGKDCEIRIHVKFGEDETLVDRVVFVPVEGE